MTIWPLLAADRALGSIPFGMALDARIDVELDTSKCKGTAVGLLALVVSTEVVLAQVARGSDDARSRRPYALR